MMRSSEEVLVTVAGDTLLGNEYANGMAGVEDALRVGVVDQRRGGEREGVEDAERQLGRCFSRGRAGHVALSVLFSAPTCPQ